MVFRSLKVAKHSGGGREPRAVTDGTTLLFGLPGLWVGRVERWADGTRVVHAVTASEAAAACPSCGVVSTSVKARVTTSPRDIPYGQERIILRWNKTRWRCREDYCERGSFTESIAQVPARARTTGRLRTQIGAAIGEAARSVAEVAAAHGVSWPTAHRAFITHAEVELTEPQPTQVIGIDETRRGKPRWEHCAQTRRWVRVDPWDTGFVDLAGSQGLLGQREGRTGAAVIEWLRERTPEFREAIEFVAIDPAAVYASAIRTAGLLPNATTVVDHFYDDLRVMPTWSVLPLVGAGVRCCEVGIIRASAQAGLSISGERHCHAQHVRSIEGPVHRAVDTFRFRAVR